MSKRAKYWVLKSAMACIGGNAWLREWEGGENMLTRVEHSGLRFRTRREAKEHPAYKHPHYKFKPEPVR